MLFLVLTVFVLLPIVEIAVLIRLAEIISIGPTLLLIVATAVIGVFLLRRQGISSLMRAQASMAQGRVPVEGLYDAAGLMLAGAFLLTPGLITDTLGFALLVPSFRHMLGRIVFGRMVGRETARGNVFGPGFGTRPGGGEGGRWPDEGNCNTGSRSQHGGEIVEGEAIEVGKDQGEGGENGQKNDNDRESAGGKGAREHSPWKR